jgi:hypothetical protein
MILAFLFKSLETDWTMKDSSVRGSQATAETRQVRALPISLFPKHLILPAANNLRPFSARRAKSALSRQFFLLYHRLAERLYLPA